ncbi:hypothetical protein ACOZ17_000255 [Cronobacter sakazakii]|uniref:hypothetical protein n=1 Tax=Cronobacter TaxID=413496 RepID=UPI001588112D|nr:MULTISPECIES: hypothetical protein [Cronobacter]ELY2757917.1 hypothetical protein [Cronobacter sakazakii]ELY2854158.1 hypothetical protein [Cronobacter dublinensis]ELY3999351.1 hypothetical protein [Cronobacter sakazakii]ELY4070261.1 hypothetical protein [Cronobacter sakazakii]ELY4182677.1 hypothetical protein [Cronobacter sakazakii]
MSEEQSDRLAAMRLRLQRRLEKVSPELFAQFLYEKGIDAVACRMCGKEALGTPQVELLEVGPSDSGKKSFVDYVKVESGSASYSLSLANINYRLICNNCGYTILFAAYPIIKWIEERESQNG